MKMQNVIILSLLTWLYVPAMSAQYNLERDFLTANSVWVFGVRGGFDKKNDQAFESALNVLEGCASVADRSTGELLFYSDGQAGSYNRNHAQMPNGGGLLGNSGSTTQGTVIVPFVDSVDKFFLFSLGSFEGREGKLYYSVVDMSLDNGLGDIPPQRKNILIDSGLCESMIAIPGDQCDVWLIVHTKDSAYFKAYHITQAGLALTPVVSYTGQQLQYSGTFGSGNTPAGAYRQGGMSVSPDRRMISIASQSVPAYQGLPSMGALLCRFDPATGVVYDGIVVEGGASCFSTIFSPDQSKLYVCGEDRVFGRSILQYDISIYNSAAIAASRTHIHGPLGNNITFKLYNDTIYLPTYPASVLRRINRPNFLGSACNFQDSALLLAPGTSAWIGLPNDVVYPLPTDTIARLQLDTLVCTAGDQEMEITLEAIPGYAYYEWHDGVTDRSRTFQEPGTYYVKRKNFCHLYIDTFVVRAAHFAFGDDTMICSYQAPLRLEVSVPNGQYIWQDGSTNDHFNVWEQGIYWVEVAVEGCRASDTIHVSVINVEQNLGPDTAFCNYDSIQLVLQATMPPGATVLWGDGSIRMRYEVTAPGEYRVQVTKDGCVGSDTLTVSWIDLYQDLGSDLLLCGEDPIDLILQANAGERADVRWSDGSVGRTLTVQDTGIYWVRVTEHGCQGHDTIVVAAKKCDCQWNLPTAFTPNNDGRNDVFRPVIEAGCPVQEYLLLIYNRWGQLVYSGADPALGWDGMYRGQPAAVGTYFYRMNIEQDGHMERLVRKGDVMLVR